MVGIEHQRGHKIFDCNISGSKFLPGIECSGINMTLL